MMNITVNIKSKNEYYVSSALDCLAACGVADRQTAYNNLIENTIRLGLMPGDENVLRETLKQYGFVMQKTDMEKMTVRDLFSFLTVSGFPDQLLLQLEYYRYFIRYDCVLAFRTGSGGEPELISEPPFPGAEYLDKKVTHLWMRWSDGIDRSPYPRKKAYNRRKPEGYSGMWRETKWFVPFQPNPCQNAIGDCVVRAFAGALDLSWADSMRLLASSDQVFLNNNAYYCPILEKLGFEKKEIKIGEKRCSMRGKEFCDEMTLTYRKRERIIVEFMDHVAALLPIRCPDDIFRYQYADFWDCSGEFVEQYWVLPEKLLPEPKDVPQEPADGLAVGGFIFHKIFGAGRIMTFLEDTVLIDFGKNGIRKIGTAWIERETGIQPKM